ncbi:MAG: HlyD family efflux transporter periplasmic adaptor subunit [Pseudolabrys sp.]
MRSTQYVSYLFRHYVLADPNAKAPAATGKERTWFIGYGALSTLYRVWLVLSISFFVARTYPLIGGGLAIWSIGGMVWAPVAGLFKLIALPKKNMPRLPALKRIGGLTLALILLFFAVPFPLHLVADGVVWLPDEANVRTQAAGEIVRVLAGPGSQVAAGQPLVVLENQDSRSKLTRARAEINELEAMRTAQAGHGRVVNASKLDDRLSAARQRLSEAEKDVANLLVRSPVSGTLLFASYDGLIGRYLPKGQSADAVIWNGDTVIVRVLVPVEDIDRLRSRVRSVQIRPGYDVDTVLPGHVLRVVPSAVDRPPSLVLSTEGGGSIAVMGAGRDSQPKAGTLDIVAERPAYLATPMFQLTFNAMHRCRSPS